VQKGFPGISLYVKDGEGIWVGSAGYADIDEGVKFEPCHVSKAASITKLMVGTLTMKLQEEGVLDIDDPVSKYIESSILDKINHPEGMTIKNLMNHTTGIADLIKTNAFYLDVLNYPNKTWEPEELVKYIYGADPVELTAEFPASYSNTNTLLLSICIDKAVGKPHYKLLREKILDPLGMSDSYYQSREKLPSITAQGYFDLHNVGELVNVSNFITGSGNGYGGMFSNVFDLSIFLNALVVEKTLLSQASLNEMLAEFNPSSVEPVVGQVEAGVSFLKKFGNMPHTGIGHSGKDLGYTADMFYFPDIDRTMIFFINYGTDAESHLKSEFYNFEYDILTTLLSN
jgi:D-alanyl-D-alanine carboxypeptidase